MHLLEAIFIARFRKISAFLVHQEKSLEFGANRYQMFAHDTAKDHLNKKHEKLAIFIHFLNKIFQNFNFLFTASTVCYDRSMQRGRYLPELSTLYL